ncbi:MAG: aspartate 1-decarboxylase [candidate division KSB1 bacterium]|nr:aspartate 1-decarboxylase [candidate division KSB1 bacterium]
MLVHVLKAKIQYATVTDARLEYEGSLTLDREIMEAAGLLPHEQVQVLNLNNGDRSETYLIEGPAGSGVVCLNGPLARRGQIGDRIIVLAYCLLGEEEARSWQPRIVFLAEGNRVHRIRS